ncbi:hypothetical protein PZA11_004008 [Diplocarpon coronariae]|uniref:Uncharacterized protein n=1 Tax=Diplocarpon coronariae TaxID=2795749 RepID=A0A218YZT2_9HELO|nr:hypothetical protein JHW43_003844 [Diplocarpon mali]OWP01321.1 hypothetical protein B2J93_7305 [Marssonina coronariae]
MNQQVHRKPISAAYAGPQSPDLYGHSRSRTTSSNVLPHQYQQHQTNPYPVPQQQQQQQQQQHSLNTMQVHSYTSRRTPSNATFATTSSGNASVGVRGPSQDLRRSTSSRSGGMQPSSYVALMRKQKATVWCDRAQHEDPRLLAAQKAAKLRATMEVVGGQHGRVSTSGSGNASLAGSNRVTAKIRHHGKSGLVGYSPGDLVGGVGGVPMRLSASEVEGGDSDEEDREGGYGSGGGGRMYHHRTGSGRSSLGSARKGLTYSSSRKSGASITVAGDMDDVSEAVETPVPGQTKEDYFAGGDGTRSAGSGSSGERADAVTELNLGDAARLASNSLLKSTVTRQKSVKNPDELRRRGSVDDRTMTMSAGRLYIANPDADSD